MPLRICFPFLMSKPLRGAQRWDHWALNTYHDGSSRYGGWSPFFIQSSAHIWPEPQVKKNCCIHTQMQMMSSWNLLSESLKRERFSHDISIGPLKKWATYVAQLVHLWSPKGSAGCQEEGGRNFVFKTSLNTVQISQLRVIIFIWQKLIISSFVISQPCCFDLPLKDRKDLTSQPILKSTVSQVEFCIIFSDHMSLFLSFQGLLLSNCKDGDLLHSRMRNKGLPHRRNLRDEVVVF